MSTVPPPRGPWPPRALRNYLAGTPVTPNLQLPAPTAGRHQVFRSFSVGDFVETESWKHLDRVLAGNGGSYGLFGPRGSGKSWLMMRAITQANDSRGLGLWFPCPAQYDATDFLSALSDNLASAVERRFVRKSPLMLALRRGQILLVASMILIFFFGLVIAVLNDIFAAAAHRSAAVTFSALPQWMFALIAASLFLLIVVYAATLVRDSTPTGRLVREASSLRERIRFTASLRLGSEMGVSATRSLASTFSMSREKTLDERPTSVASLIFDFRNLVEQIATTVRGQVVIGIDELDKIDNADKVRQMLRDVKGIFEVTGVHFLVSISAEAVNSLQLGTLHPDGRNEFNSSLYTVIELPPLGPDGATELLARRQCPASDRLAAALCVLSGGNQRELVRLADVCMTYSGQRGPVLDEKAIMTVLERESAALLAQIIRTMAGDSPDDARYGVWNALPRESFASVTKFIALGQSAINDLWSPSWGQDWDNSLQESWRRLLIRMFVASRLLAPISRGKSLLDTPAALVDLRDVLIAASGDVGIGRVLLTSRFGNSGEYRSGPSVNSLTAPMPHS